MIAAKIAQAVRGAVAAILLAAPVAAAGASDATQHAAAMVFDLPPSWEAVGDSPVIARAPEGDLEIAIVDTGRQPDARTALEAAWRAYSDQPLRPVRLRTPLAPRNGWRQREEFRFETATAEHRAVEAIAALGEAGWVVAILAGNLDTLDKRGAAVDIILGSLRPRDTAREDFSGDAPHPWTDERIDLLKAFLREAMDDLGVPGVAFALVAGDRVVFEGGLGVRALGGTEPVTADTRFMIASNTKPLTTMLLASLVDDGQLAWDQPVVDAWSTFRLGDDATSKQVLVRHLVCACTGLPRQDYGWIFGTSAQTTAQATFAQLATTEVTSDFGEVFQYSNLMAAAGGYVAARADLPGSPPGEAYDRAMQARVFDPIGMSATTFDMAEALAGNHARPHGPGIDGEVSRADLGLNRAILPYRPAGGAWSTVRDMRRYVQTELADGLSPDGRRVVSTDGMRERRARGIQSGNDMWYGMGIEEVRVAGLRIYRHGGSLPGYISDFFVLPDAGLGAVILTNSSTGGMLIDPFLRRLLEILYDAEPRAAAAIDSAAERSRLRYAERRASLAVPPPEDVAARLAARYSHPQLGSIEVLAGTTGLRFDFGLWSSAVAARRNDDGSLSLLTTDPGVDRFEFVLAESNGRPALRVREAQHDYLFVADEIPAGR